MGEKDIGENLSSVLDNILRGKTDKEDPIFVAILQGSESENKKLTEPFRAQNVTFVTFGMDNDDFSAGNFLSKNSSKMDVVISDRIFDGNFKDEKTSEILSGILSLLKSGGILLLREDLSQKKISLAQVTDMLDHYRVVLGRDGNGHKDLVGFQFHWMKGIRTSILENGNWLDLCWCVEKTIFHPETNTSTEPVSVRDFLDKKQYCDSGIGAYEWIFGKGFISPGGGKKNDQFLRELNAKPGQIMLDIGSGIGGSAFQASELFGCKVLGIDLSSNMGAVAIERAHAEQDKRVEFMIADAVGFNFPENSFNFIYSRDCIIHIRDKVGLFKRFFKWLKPGGIVFLTDYNTGSKDHSPAFKLYLEDRQYALTPIADYVTALKQAGFLDVEGRDMTSDFEQILKLEMGKVTSDKEAFYKEFSESKFNSLIEGWKNKLGYIASGDHKWGAFKGRKPK